MRHLLYLMFRCDVDVIESLELEGSFLGTKHSLIGLKKAEKKGDTPDGGEPGK